MTQKINFEIDSVNDLVNARIKPATQAQVRTIVLLIAVTCLAKLIINPFKCKRHEILK